MTSHPIVESGMTFGPFPTGHCFHIEKSETYRRVQSGVKMAEFLLLRPKKGEAAAVWVVEAKSSSPKPATQPDFDEFIEEIREKLTNALSLGIAVFLKRHEATYVDLPGPFQQLDLSNTDFRFVLVIKGHEEAWLSDLADALTIALRSIVNIWALSLSTVVVLNDGMAKQYGLIGA